MREITQKIYQFDELNAEVQKKVIDRFRNKQSFFDETMFSEDMSCKLDSLLSENNIEDIDENSRLFYSLNHCQGDGVCFIGKFKWKDYIIKILHNYRYYHEKSVTFEIEDVEGNDVNESIYSEFQNLFETICRELERYGYDIIEDIDSDERIKENIEINEYEFYEDGRLF